MKHFTLTNKDFAKILRIFHESGSPIGSRMDRLGCFYLVRDTERGFYHIFHSSTDNTRFALEYFYFSECLSISGDVDYFVKTFGVKLKESN